MSPKVMAAIAALLTNIPEEWIRSLNLQLKGSTPLSFPFQAIEPWRAQVSSAIDVFLVVLDFVQAMTTIKAQTDAQIASAAPQAPVTK